MKIAGVYAIRHLESGKLYVGSSVDIRSRWSGHRCDLRKRRHHAHHLQHAWDLYGESAFEFSILEEISDRPARLTRETELIAERGCIGRNGYNCLPVAGSREGFSHSVESKAKMSSSHKKIADVIRNLGGFSWSGRRHSTETRAKMSSNNSRHSPSFEHRAAISAAHRGKTISDAHKAAMAVACRIKNKTPEMRAKVSAALKGRVITPEWRAKLSAAAKNRVTKNTKAKEAYTV
jgi:group I intron endonuclease